MGLCLVQISPASHALPQHPPPQTSDPADKNGEEEEEWHPLPEGQAYNQPSHGPTTCLSPGGTAGGRGWMGEVRQG